MKFSIATTLVVSLAAQTTVASWFGKSAYNAWHETELERWLDDHNIKYPTPADRKDLENIVKENWEKGVTQVESKAADAQAEGASQANTAYSSVKDWIFDTWTESQLKAFLDKHGIPNPQPRTRDSLLATARSNYQTVANKLGESVNYPGNWLYEQWSDSELKAWLDERGVPVPQPSSRDKLIASVRRNAKIASDRAAEQYASASSSAASAQQSLSDALLESWSDSQIKEWADKHGIKVPQGSKRNELIALARKHSAQFVNGNTASSASKSAASAYGAATSSAGNWFAQSTDDAYGGARYYYDWVANQLGFASADAQKSLSSASSSWSSASSTASVEASKSSVLASKSASSAASVASKSASSAGSLGSKSASSASSAASKSGQSAASKAGEAYKKATDRVKEEL